MDEKTDEITLKGINGDKPFKIEILSAEGAEIMSEAKETAEGLENKATRNFFITQRTVFAILLSSDSLMAQLKYEKDCPEYRDAIEAMTKVITTRMKMTALTEFINKFHEVNDVFLAKAGKSPQTKRCQA